MQLKQNEGYYRVLVKLKDSVIVVDYHYQLKGSVIVVDYQYQLKGSVAAD
jgi:hypothetical protein